MGGERADGWTVCQVWQRTIRWQNVAVWDLGDRRGRYQLGRGTRTTTRRALMKFVEGGGAALALAGKTLGAPLPCESSQSP